MDQFLSFEFTDLIIKVVLFQEINVIFYERLGCRGKKTYSYPNFITFKFFSSMHFIYPLLKLFSL